MLNKNKYIFIYSRGKFLELNNQFLSDKAIIRIHNKKDYDFYKQEKNANNVLELFFDDLGINQLSFLDKINAIFNLNLNNVRYPLNKNQALEIKKFVEKFINKKDFVIHCEYGKSRSVALGLFLENKFSYKIKNKDISELKNPNRWVIYMLNKY